jgi:hypothetical protein
MEIYSDIFHLKKIYTRLKYWRKFSKKRKEKLSRGLFYILVESFSIDLINANFSQIECSTFSSTCVPNVRDATRCENVTFSFYHHVIHHDIHRQIFFAWTENFLQWRVTFPRCENWQLWGSMLWVKLAKSHTFARRGREMRLIE